MHFMLMGWMNMWPPSVAGGHKEMGHQHDKQPRQTKCGAIVYLDRNERAQTIVSWETGTQHWW